MSHISYDVFQSLDMRVGTVRFVEAVPESDKLYRCLVDFGEELKTDVYTDAEGNSFPVRQIVSGIREYYPDPAVLIGRQVLYCVNLEPRTIKGVTSHGMLMAIGDNDCIFLSPSKPVPPGSKIR